MAALPLELITEIWVRLPVKSLLRFRCVSKEWRDLIDSVFFRELQLSRSKESSTHIDIFLWRSSELYRIGLGSLRGVVSIDHPFSGSPRRENRRIKVLGSCNGLLCISNWTDLVVMWNPSTRKCKRLCKVPEPPALDFLFYGFGYDKENDDYVLLRLKHFETRDAESEVRIRSLKNQDWRELGNIPYFLYYVNKMGVFVCGRLHWIMTRELVSDSAKMLVAYDFRTEVHMELDLPDVIDDKLDMNVAALGGCLCLSVNDNHKNVDVWIMKEYELKKSWTRIISIPRSEVGGPLGYVRPLVYSNNGRKVLVRLDDKNLAWYDLGTKCIVRVDIRGMPSSCEAELCFATLVSVVDAARNRREGEQEHEGSWASL